MDPRHELRRELTRRHFLGGGLSLSVGALAARSLFAQDSGSAAPRAKRIVYLHMAGSPSQLDLFDPKPKLRELDGQRVSESLIAGERFAFIKGVPKALGS